jgi:hypothetical protein
MTSISASYAAFLPPTGVRQTAPAAAEEPAAGNASSATEPASAATSAKAAEKAVDKASARSTGELDPAELAKLRELQAIDRKVHAHESAHAAVAGNLGGAKSFSYVTGPDGVRYAVAGEVDISFGESSNPSVTLENAARVRAAALAPADPSSQDLRVAARAQQLILQAQLELSREPAKAGPPDDSSSPTSADHPNIKAFRSVAEAATIRTPQLDVQA